MKLSRRHRLLAFLLSFDSVFVGIGTAFYDAHPIPGGEVFLTRKHGSTLTAEGKISAPMIHSVQKAAILDPQIRSLYLVSPGGTLPAARQLAHLIDKHHWQLNLEGGFCASACVYVLTHTPEHQIAPGEIFLFHEGQLSGGWLGELLYYGHSGHWFHPHAMLSWANRISPRLGSYLQSCHPNPVYTHKGLWLNWQTIQKIAAGRAVPNCSTIQRQETPAWREQHFGIYYQHTS